MFTHAKSVIRQRQKLRFQYLALHKVQYMTTMGNNTSDKSSELHAATIPDYSTFVKDLVKDNCILVFSKSRCPYCAKVRQIFKENKVQCITWMELDQRNDGDKIQEVLKDMTGAGTVPRVFVNGECIGGASDTEKLHKENKLMEKIEGCKNKNDA